MSDEPDDVAFERPNPRVCFAWLASRLLIWLLVAAGLGIASGYRPQSFDEFLVSKRLMEGNECDPPFRVEFAISGAQGLAVAMCPAVAQLNRESDRFVRFFQSPVGRRG